MTNKEWILSYIYYEKTCFFLPVMHVKLL